MTNLCLNLLNFVIGRANNQIQNFYEHTADDCKHFEMLKFSLQKYDFQ